MQKYVKRLSIVSMSLCALVFSSCGDSSDHTGSEVETVSKVGVWSDGTHFVSINSDDFLTSYVASGFIDCGDVYEDGSTITCHNVYFNKSTVYKVLSATKTEMRLAVSYRDALGQDKDTILSLIKTAQTPASKDCILLGKSYTFRTSYVGNVTLAFSTYSVGLMTSSSTICRKYPLTTFYVFLDDKLYFQKFTQKGIQVPSIGGWTTDVDDGGITVYKLKFGTDGSVVGHENITREAL